MEKGVIGFDPQYVLSFDYDEEDGESDFAGGGPGRYTLPDRWGPRLRAGDKKRRTVIRVKDVVAMLRKHGELGEIG